MPYQLAQVNVARMLAPIDSPVMADFVASLDSVNALAERSEGFAWRLKEDNNNATSIKISGDEFLIVNLSVWENTDALFRFVYQSNHVEVFKRRREWFEKMPVMHMALWYIQERQWPTVAEATERLQYVRDNGDTPYSFGFKKRFTPEEANEFNPFP